MPGGPIRPTGPLTILISFDPAFLLAPVDNSHWIKFIQLKRKISFLERRKGSTMIDDHCAADNLLGHMQMSGLSVTICQRACPLEAAASNQRIILRSVLFTQLEDIQRDFYWSCNHKKRFTQKLLNYNFFQWMLPYWTNAVHAGKMSCPRPYHASCSVCNILAKFLELNCSWEDGLDTNDMYIYIYTGLAKTA